MQEMRWWAMTKQELTLKNTESEEVIDLYDNKFWWLFMQISIQK